MKLRLLNLLVVLLLASVVTGVHAQGLESITTIKNEPVTYTFLSRFAPVVGRQPQHGTVSMVEDPVFNYTLTYTPDQDFLGSDDLLLVSFPFGVNVAFTEFDVTVAEADIRARHDFASTLQGQPVSVPVTANDYANVGEIELTAVPVANAGTATVEGDNVRFTPAPGFVGLTDFNYVICTYGVCDLGTVSVNVLPDGAGTSEPDTVRVFTKRNLPQYIFAPANAVAAAPPVSGSMVDVEGVMAYQPAEDFVGDEYLTYTTPGAAAPTVYHVTVLDLEANAFAFPDQASTAVDATVRFNVLHNDLYDVFADCVSFGTPQFGTLTETDRKGEVIYTPPAGWSGVDRFEYSSMAPGCDGAVEQQTAFVFVSNFAPAAGETTLTTPAGSPVRLTYAAPGGESDWSVTAAPNHGALYTDADTGEWVYLPDAGSAGQTDVVQLTYCLNPDGNGNCAFSTQVAVNVAITAPDDNGCDDQDCVWPGDTNNDGVVDVGDLLPIGLAMGASGTPRPTTDPTSWAAQYGEDWGSQLNGLDHKYIDANGDQVISSLDTQVVMQNLGLAHRLRPAHQQYTDFQISLQGDAVYEPGDQIQLQIVAGNEFVGVEDVYGFRLQFTYDINAVDPQSVDVSFDEESWLSYDSPILAVGRNQPAAGVINSAVTRTSGLSTSGFGIIGTLNVVGVEDVYGFFGDYEGPEQNTGSTEIVTTIGGGEATGITTGAGHQAAVHVAPFELTIRQVPPTEVGEFTPAEATSYLNGKLLAYPNPTADRLTVHLNGQQQFTQLRLVDMTGRSVMNRSGLRTNHAELSVGHLPVGFYTLTLTTEDGVVNRKVEIIR